MATLFELGRDLTSMLHTIQDDGELTPELEAYFSDIAVLEANKLDAYIELIRTVESEKALAISEAEQFAMKARQRENKIKALKQRLMDHLQLTGRERATTAKGRQIRIAKNGGSQSINVEIEKIPEEYKKTRTVEEPDIDLIRQQLLDGRELNFASLAPRGVHLRIS